MKKYFLMALTAGLFLTGCDNVTTPAPLASENSLAPFLETTQTARMLGGSLELSKMEGLAYDEKSRILYVAMSRIEKKMIDAEGGIQMPKNICGGIFAAQLDSNLVATKITPVLMGQQSADGKTCSQDAIAEPDNLYLDGKGRLWIGEDTSHHTTNMLWVYEPANGSLKRFATVPLGAEVTGLHISATGDVFMNVQHPDKANPAPFNKGTVGVVSGFNAHASDFAGLGVPQGEAQKTVQVAAGTYTILSQSGEAGAGVVSGSAQPCNNPDGNMLLPSGNDAVLYTNFECVPGGVLKQNLKRVNGSWTVEGRQMVDFSAVNGTWRNCNGSVSPWNTALSSEEDAVEDTSLSEWQSWDEYKAMSAHIGKSANRYDYGYIMEITPTATGSEVRKRYALGRTNFEMALVLPDRKTVYLGDDGNTRGMYKFVADTAGDLSAGTLYTAQFTQVDDATSANGKSLNVTWLRMGHGVESEIAAAIRRLN
ncbi:alkaline phosphatase PhoX [Deinococcus lacus]|uniref:Alkaline phosphatase PhoX n=1 Tax=Deinococcus lacus TaxID=392561 RepID=A0ABW1YCY1_9DEIO